MSTMYLPDLLNAENKRRQKHMALGELKRSYATVRAER